jgi:exopolyphosphatase / guanosine-5'-triphosphate,3'-diphosphate pyrophosphatase
LKVSVIDLGFNSIKLVNYQVNKDNSYKAYEQKRMNVRLGEGLDSTGHLNDKSIQRTIDSLKFFRDIINFQSIKDVLPVATSAVREASNQKDFLKEIYEETGFRFRVLSGKEEALYSYLGALKSVCIPTTLFFDLGGGSIEMVYTENFKIKKFISLPIGALRLSLTYGRMDDTFAKERYEKMKQYILESLPDRKELDMSPKPKLLGVGGTLRAIARYHYYYNYNHDQGLGSCELDRKIRNCRLDYESIAMIHKKLYKMKPKDIAKISAIGKNRANTITAGSCVIGMLMMKLGFGKVIASASGLRDGILSSFLERPISYSGEDINNKNNNKLDSNQIQNSLNLFVDLRKVKKSTNDI